MIFVCCELVVGVFGVCCFGLCTVGVEFGLVVVFGSLLCLVGCFVW